MNVWGLLVGQKPVIDMLNRIAQGGPGQITQSWLICGPPGSGRSNMVQAFTAALENPGHGMSTEPTRVIQQVLAGTHPDVMVLTTSRVTIGVDQVREIITTSGQVPATTPQRIIVIEDVDRMLERTINVLLGEIEGPAEHCIWLLCASSAQGVLPTIRSRARVMNLAMPSIRAVAGFLTSTTNVKPRMAQRATRLAEGHTGITKLYAADRRVMSDHDELMVGMLNLARTSNVMLSADNLIDNVKAQAEADASRITTGQEAEFRHINGLAPSDRIPSKLRGTFNQIAKKDDAKRLVTRRTRDALDRTLNFIASIYRDMAVLQNNTEDSVGPINLENRSSITELSARLNRAGVTTRLDEVTHTHKHLAGSGNPLLVLGSLFCVLIS